MSIHKELDKLTNSDIYSLMLFALYKSNEIPEYSSLSQLSYILDKSNLLKLCEFYGGTTIYIPTIYELETLLNALLLYQKVDIEHREIEEELDKMRASTGTTTEIRKFYLLLKDVLNKYSFNSGRI